MTSSRNGLSNWLLGLAALCSSAVLAQPYGGIDGGWSRTRDGVFDLPTTAIPRHPTGYDSGWMLALRGGWRFAPTGPGAPRAELELSWRTNPVDRFGGDGSVGPGAGRQRALAVMVNALFDFDTRSPWVPSLGLGAGWLRGHAADVRRDMSLPDCCTALVDGRDEALAWQAMAGLGYQLNPRTVLSLDWRHLRSSRALSYGYRGGCYPDGSFCVAQPGTTAAGYTSRTLAVGVRLAF